MPQYVSIRFYKLRDDADSAAFEQAFRDVRPTWGIERVMLLRGFKADTHPLAPSEYDYGSVHVYSDLDDAVKTVGMAGDLAEKDEIPDALQPFVRFWRTAHAGPIEQGVVNGFTLISESPEGLNPRGPTAAKGR